MTGFSDLSAAERREMARKGGKAVPDHKRSFARDHDLAAAAGRKGGLQRAKNAKAS